MKYLLVAMTVVAVGAVAWLLAYERPSEAVQDPVETAEVTPVSQACARQGGGCCTPPQMPACQGDGCATCPMKASGKKMTSMGRCSAVQAVTEHVLTETEVGKDVVCPVLGTKFTVGQGTPALEYKDKVYYFCCAGCPKKFKAAPHEYLGTN